MLVSRTATAARPCCGRACAPRGSTGSWPPARRRGARRAHAARALQLTSDRSRRGLARSLERLIEQSERPPAPFRGAAVQPCREQVREALPEILAIASRLRSGAPVDARGVARLRGLLCDGCGPCYAPSRPDALSIALSTVSDMLDVQD